MLKREVIHADVVCVGAGVASLSAAIRFLKRCRADGGGRNRPTVLIVEKGKQAGSHALSGAVVNPEPVRRLLGPDEMASLPLEAVVHSESLYFLTGRGQIKLPFVPPPMSARGLPAASLSRLTARLAEICESLGGEIYTDIPAVELLQDESGRITGVRTGDKGSDRNGQPAAVPVSGCGCRGKGRAGFRRAVRQIPRESPAPSAPPVPGRQSDR